MPPTVYAIAGGKGGVGKTTTAVNLARTVATTGREVLVVDADLAMSNLREMLALEAGPTLHDVLAGDAAATDAIVSAVDDRPTEDGRLDVLPGSTDLDAFARVDPADLPPLIHALESRYDAIVVDTASGVTRESAIPVEVADRTVVVTTPDERAVQDAEKTIELVRHSGGTVAGYLVVDSCSGVEPAAIDERLEARRLGSIPEFGASGGDPRAAYRRFAARLLLDGDLPEDVAAALGVDESARARITSTLDPSEGDAGRGEVSEVLLDQLGIPVRDEVESDEGGDDESGSGGALGRFVDAISGSGD